MAWTSAHSAGGVVLRASRGGYEFVAIRPAGQHRWQLPKGTIDGTESAREAAVREVREETGVLGQIIFDLGSISYFFRSGERRFHKRVDFFLMRYLGGNTADHDDEVDEAVWMSGFCVRQLTFKSERQTVEKALALAESGAMDLHPQEE